MGKSLKGKECGKGIYQRKILYNIAGSEKLAC